MSGAAGAAAAAAAAKQRSEREEEEEMTSYGDPDFSNWEFKILRSVRQTFKNPEKLREILAEEGLAGWSLVEKFDNTRIRLKRPITAKAKDSGLAFDPYRSYVGYTENQYGLVVLAWVLAIMAACGLAFGLLIYILR
jgi:hypothetical protein